MVRGAILVGGLVLALSAGLPARAEVNPEGVSGVLNTPTAEVVADGRAVATMGRFLRRMDNGLPDSVTRSYSMTLGYLPRFEVTARFIDLPTVFDSQGTTNYQDRSISGKYRIPLNEKWAAALGATDVGGESQISKAYYGVVTYQPRPELSLSLGAGTDRLEGVFANARWSPHERVSLLAEYDAQDLNYGVTIKPLKGLALTAGMVNNHSAFSTSYSFPLNPRGPATPCCPVELQPSGTAYASPEEQACAVRDALTAESYENVVAGVAGDTIYIECESRRFTEQLDALAIAAALAVEHAGAGITRIEVSPKIEDVPQLTFCADIDSFIAFLADPQACPDGLATVPYEPGRFPEGTVFACEGNKKPGHGEVQIRPLNSFEITRPGRPTFMTKWGLGLEERVSLARGLRLQARQDWNILNDQEPGEKTKPVNRDALLIYTDAWTRDLRVSANVGYLGNAHFGGIADAGYYFPEGRVKLGARYGYVRSELEGDTDKEDGVALADVSYFEPGLDWQVTLQGGQFLKGDQGLRVESARYFGPTEIRFFAYDTNQSSPHGGFQLFLPLPWYKQQRHGAWRVIGAPYFPYQYRTDSDPWGDPGASGLDVDTLRQRLRPEYVGAHLEQFRRAIKVFTSQRP